MEAAAMSERDIERLYKRQDKLERQVGKLYGLHNETNSGVKVLLERTQHLVTDKELAEVKDEMQRQHKADCPVRGDNSGILNIPANAATNDTLSGDRVVQQAIGAVVMKWGAILTGSGGLGAGIYHIIQVLGGQS